jgi:hypothetical protein
MRHLAVCATALLSIGGLVSAQNILNNGGFEFGLMCFGTNVWRTRPRETTHFP